ncbi:haloalkane dehalogenase [Dyadobacter fanqingshengii]|uniref:Haloalkane dehalogenase n=1 Tax=Dyadobacter fanqingshengii TaxID=2906443 RepID=A0A9X1PCV4_9BACT|nr:haloalkane dehalogenase [Dyadobacter fanqingshengii]MCF0041363.1 haloalkane dehalogenase [Dyadobacter fanqingshengii]USJ36915.1 haloalkane dehalogenase [Dyadobacter fanqingshengii]
METTQNTQADIAFESQKKFARINGLNMAYIDKGEGDPIIFLHGNPTSGYIWRNVLPHVQDLGRCIVPDLIGMGDSDHFRKAADYTFANNEQYLDKLFSVLGVRKNITFVVHDWGSVLAFYWARKHPGAVKGIVYMEAITRPRSWEEVPGAARETFQKLRTSQGEQMVLIENSFIEFNLPRTILRTLSDEEMAAYRRPFCEPGESRRAMLSWARQLPLGGEPAEMIRIVNENSSWLAKSPIPKLFIEAMPGTLADAEKQACMRWPNQTHVAVRGHHNLQEDSAGEIGAAILEWLGKIG